EVVSEFGCVDVLVKNGGISKEKLVMGMKEEEWDEVIDRKLKGVFKCIEKVRGEMLGEGSGGMINVTSIVGGMGNGGEGKYVGRKGGVIGLRKSGGGEVG
ncbi:SDR family NAD(P)-dependent oxidoreductase, partial [Staphylococcus epidermidis]|uniref:SDR family NAD(P)-dependent oxidoreductase n=1 Tax=Staphylococcus epidermidis TaxID=1282 RepID=UPI0011A2DA72